MFANVSEEFGNSYYIPYVAAFVLYILIFPSEKLMLKDALF